MHAEATPDARLTEAMALDRKEWLQALGDIKAQFGEDGVREILRALQNEALSQGMVLAEATLNTPYVNTIPPFEQPA